MIISVNWLKKFTDIDLSIEELTTLIGARLVEIEKVIDLGVKYKDALIVKTISVEPMVDSDHLSIVKIDDGGAFKAIDRDEQGLIQVVCGARNIKSDQFVVWLPPTSIVPNTFDKNPLILESRKLRGYISNGMIASAHELDLFDEHEGILVLDSDLTPGSLFADVYELNDYLFDIENKSLTHRPDCFGIIGFAREVAAISGKSFKTPDWLTDLSPNFTSNNTLDIKPNVTINGNDLSDRYQAIVVSGADSSKKSPLEIQMYLARIGVRPINAVVDVTNYLMMLTGQPLHAFDYDKLISINDNADICVRAGKKGEKLQILDGRLLDISDEDIVVAAGDTAIALAGAMGGLSTSIDSSTKNIIIECATFNLYKLRATQMRHGIFSEAITRFTKGQLASLTTPVLFDAVKLMGEWSGSQSASSLVESYPNPQAMLDIQVNAEKINAILGSQFSDDYIINTLSNVEFTVIKNNEGLLVKPPYWRADVHILEDIAEEVGRLNGFDNIKSVLPCRDFSAVKFSKFDEFRYEIRNILSRSGANEVLSYSFINGDTIKRAGQSVDDSYKIINSISPDLQYYRQTLTSSLLSLVHSNIKQGFDEFALFEINKTHKKSNGLTDENVPKETDSIALIYANKDVKDGGVYYKVRSIIDYMLKVLNVEVTYTPLLGDQNYLDYSSFEPRRSAVVRSNKTNNILGVIGEYKKSVSRSFKLPEYSAGFELDIQTLFNEINELITSYLPISKYPSTYRDICLQVPQSFSYSDLVSLLNQALDGVTVLTEVSLLDIYQSDNADTKNITFRIKFTAYDRTLDSDEIEMMMSIIATAVMAKGDIKVI